MSDPTPLQLYGDYINRASKTFHLPFMLRYLNEIAAEKKANPLLRCGAKVYSQNDEDGITFEILRRLGLDTGVFAEFGVGNGTENNTLALAALGWSGFWAGGEDLGFDYNPGKADRLNFSFSKQWITKDNIVGLYQAGLAAIGQESVNLISLDLDGNDWHFVSELLEYGARPDVFIVEYNAKFIPPIKFVIEYDENHQYESNDYFGSSLSSYVELFEKYSYTLVCCNVTGANAFFVKNFHAHLFEDVPRDIRALFSAPRYFLTALELAGHPLSIRTIESIMRSLNSGRPNTSLTTGGPSLGSPAT